MKKARYTAEQIAFALRQAETGTAVAEVCRKLGISEQTFHRWKKQYAGLGVGDIRRLKQLVADLSLDKLMLQDVLAKKRCSSGLKVPRASRTTGRPWR